MADIMNEEKVCSQNWIYYKSWFLNARFPSEEKLNAHTSGKWEEWDEAKLVDDCTEANIIQTYWDGSCLTTYLLGCDGLDFAICHMELEDGNLEIDSDIEPLKWNEGDEGWYLHEYNEKLLDCNGNETERLYDFDHVENNDVFRVPFEDLDAEAYRNGKVVLTKEAEEKWKKILRGKLPRPVYGIPVGEDVVEEDEEDDASQQEGTLIDYFVTINENGVNRDVALYLDSKGLYIKGSAIETLKATDEGKWYIQTSSGFAKDFSQIEPSPKTYLQSKEWSLEQGTCDIVSKRKKGEDSKGSFNPDLNTLDDLLQL